MRVDIHDDLIEPIVFDVVEQGLGSLQTVGLQIDGKQPVRLERKYETRLSVGVVEMLWIVLFDNHWTKCIWGFRNGNGPKGVRFL